MSIREGAFKANMEFSILGIIWVKLGDNFLECALKTNNFIHKTRYQSKVLMFAAKWGNLTSWLCPLSCCAHHLCRQLCGCHPRESSPQFCQCKPSHLPAKGNFVKL